MNRRQSWRRWLRSGTRRRFGAGNRAVRRIERTSRLQGWRRGAHRTPRRTDGQSGRFAFTECRRRLDGQRRLAGDLRCGRRRRRQRRLCRRNNRRRRNFDRLFNRFGGWRGFDHFCNRFFPCRFWKASRRRRSDSRSGLDDRRRSVHHGRGGCLIVSHRRISDRQCCGFRECGHAGGGFLRCRGLRRSGRIGRRRASSHRWCGW